jgi:hypothetical protein
MCIPIVADRNYLGESKVESPESRDDIDHQHIPPAPRDWPLYGHFSFILQIIFRNLSTYM